MTGGSHVRVALDDLILDREYQTRLALDHGAIRRYADAMRTGHKLPPITIARVDGAPVVIDGWHRVHAAKLAGIAALPALLIDPPEAELPWLAAEANLRHGVPLKRSERRNVFRAYVRAGQHLKGRRRIKSSREISSDLHGLISHAGVLKWMAEDFPHIRRQMGRAEDEPRYEGGLAVVDVEERREMAVRNAIGEVVAHARGITDPLRRGQVIAELRAALERIEAAAPWEPVPATDGFADDDF